MQKYLINGDVSDIVAAVVIYWYLFSYFTVLYTVYAMALAQSGLHVLVNIASSVTAIAFLGRESGSCL